MRLKDFFEENRKFALAFSGGVDSAYLMYNAVKYGCDFRAYYVKTEFEPQFELRDALRLAESLDVDIKVIDHSILDSKDIMKNDIKRCYYCKKMILQTIIKEASKDGYKLLIDGSNASDNVDERPGSKALKELKVRSPLREASIYKKEIREKAKKAGLFNWNKPAYACLATRIPSGDTISTKKLLAIEEGEEFMKEMGFSDFRVRCIGDDMARIEILDKDFMRFFENHKKINTELGKYFKKILLDLEARDEEHS